MRRRQYLLAAGGTVFTIGIAGCTGDSEVGTGDDPDENEVTVNEYWFERDEREFGDDSILFFVEVENQTNEEQNVNVKAELYEDNLLLDDVGPWITIPPNATTQEDRMFFELDPEDIERVTHYIIRASGFWDDPIVISEGSGDEFRDELGE